MPAVSLRLLGIVLVCWAVVPAPAQTPPELPPADTIAPQLFATGMAPAVAIAFDRQGAAYVGNYRRTGTLGRILPDGTASLLCDLAEVVPLESRTPRVTGIRIDVEGRLIVADSGGGRLLRVDADGSRVDVLADRFEGERFLTVEAVALDRMGNIYFTDSGRPPADIATEAESVESSGEEGQSVFEAAPEEPAGALYRYDIQVHKVTRLATGLDRPSGLAMAPDQERLIVAESGLDRLLVYRLGAQGEIASREVLVDFAPPPAESQVQEESDEPAALPEEAVDPSAAEQPTAFVGPGEDAPTAGALQQSEPQPTPAERSVLAGPGAVEDTAESLPVLPDPPAPRGLVFGVAGRIYVALAGEGQIAVIDLESGEQLRRYDAGGAGASDCHFHEGDLFTAISTKEAIFRLPLSIGGYDYSGQ